MNTLVLSAGMLCAAMASAAATAQTATVIVSHDDPDGLVEPGQAVRIGVMVDWTGGIQLAGLAGSLGPTPDVGIASSPSSPLGGPLVNVGTPLGGGIVGYDVASIPPFFTAGPNVIPSWAFPPIPVLEYTWTAPATPGVVEFDFTPRALAPNVRLYTSLLSIAPVEAQTTYVGTSLTVVPGVGVLWAFGAAAVVVGRRRR
ncbi:MAG: hypothetical protein H6809_01855 [Phycisphaeraceae bacterium]|nr:hypothetical protein [Phycisphaeraceae bacterium]